MRREQFDPDLAPGWQRLDALTARAGRRGRGALTQAEVRELGRLFRDAVADFAHARRVIPGDPMLLRLQDRILRARAALYGEVLEQARPCAYLRTGYWRALRARRAALALAVVLFASVAVAAAVWGLLDPDSARTVVPGGFIDGADPPRGDRGLSSADSAAFSSFLFTHNIQVALLTFVAGIAFGLGSGILIAYNAVVLGALLGVAAHYHNAGQVLVLITAHGLLEISCTLIAGAAGMWMGWALVEPGAGRRRTALAERARSALAIVLGTAPWLVVCGLVEAFISPAGWPAPAVVLVGGGLLMLFWSLVLLRGRAEGTAAGQRRPLRLARR